MAIRETVGKETTIPSRMQIKREKRKEEEEGDDDGETKKTKKKKKKGDGILGWASEGESRCKIYRLLKKSILQAISRLFFYALAYM